MGLLDDITQAQYYAENDYGNYQFTSLDNIITQFQIAYVGENKIISKIKRADIAFHAQRAMQELSFDTFKSIKSQEITVPATLQMILPQDYVNYTNISWSDSSGVKHPLYPTNRTSNPFRPQQETDGDFLFDLDGNLIPSGNLLIGETFEGGAGNWNLNVSSREGTAQAAVMQPATAGADSGQVITDSVGWLWDNNSLKLYNSLAKNGIRQENVPIYSGETYTLTFTLSNHAAGNYNWYLTDEDGRRFTGDTVTADGTYTQTIDMSTATFPASNIDWTFQTISFRNDGDTGDSVSLDNVSLVRASNTETSTTWSNYKSATPSENNTDDYTDDTYWPAGGERYGLDPQHAQVNGSFYIDQQSGKIHFSSNISGKTVVLDYISDGLGTDAEMQVHKFAEEAMYKSILCAIMSAKANVGGRQLAYYKKDKFAAIRTAKLRLSNIKLEELTQILRGKSKHIKH